MSNPSERLLNLTGGSGPYQASFCNPRGFAGGVGRVEGEAS